MKHTVEVMISEQEVQERIRELGKQITERYQGSEDLVMVGLLRGSFVFMADLARAIELTHQVDFMTASSYGNTMESSRDVRILKDLDDDIKGKDVLIVEDIIDTGKTMKKLLNTLRSEFYFLYRVYKNCFPNIFHSIPSYLLRFLLLTKTNYIDLSEFFIRRFSSILVLSCCLMFSKLNPKSVRVACLLRKRTPLRCEQLVNKLKKRKKICISIT